MPKKRGRELSVGEWVRDYLLKAKTDYVGSMSRKFRKWCRDRTYKQPSYASFRRMIWVLKKLGLLELDHVGTGEKAGWPRHYYRIANGVNLKAPGWRDPMGTKYSRRYSRR